MKVIKRIKSLLDKRNSDEHPNGELEIRPEDVFLVSYPKSGNTWMRFLLSNYLFNKDKQHIDYSDLEDFIPSIHKSPIDKINSLVNPRLIKSHFVQPEYPKIIYIVRDGRDALVSYYYFLKDLQKFQGDFKTFYQNEAFGSIGHWHEHVAEALKFQKKQPKQILLIKYEDLLLDTEGELSRVLEFLNCQIDRDQLRFAIQQSSFDSLKKMQEQSEVVIEDKTVNFFRQGTSSGWKAYFDAELNAGFKANSAAVMEKFNYE